MKKGCFIFRCPQKGMPRFTFPLVPEALAHEEEKKTPLFLTNLTPSGEEREITIPATGHSSQESQ